VYLWSWVYTKLLLFVSKKTFTRSFVSLPPWILYIYIFTLRYLLNYTTLNYILLLYYSIVLYKKYLSNRHYYTWRVIYFRKCLWVTDIFTIHTLYSVINNINTEIQFALFIYIIITLKILSYTYRLVYLSSIFINDAVKQIKHFIYNMKSTMNFIIVPTIVAMSVSYEGR